MKEGIRMIKSSDKSNKEEGQKTKTTEIRVKIGMYKIKKKNFFNKYKMSLIPKETWKKCGVRTVIFDKKNHDILTPKIPDLEL